MSGTHWSWPMFSIFYYDGSRVRAYTPIRGNAVNTDFKTALGFETEYSETKENRIIKKYQKLGIYTSNLACEWACMYLKKYGLDEKSVFLDFKKLGQEL